MRRASWIKHKRKGRYLVLIPFNKGLAGSLQALDLVYYGHFKCNIRHFQDYPNLANYLRELYQWPGIKGTFDLNNIKAGYYSQQHINPTGIVPVGPTLDHLEWPHDRSHLAAMPD